MEGMNLDLLAEKLEIELVLYLGREYHYLKIEAIAKSGTIFLYISDSMVHLEPMETVDLKDILQRYDSIYSENVNVFLADAAKLCLQRYEAYKKKDGHKARELSGILREYPKSCIFSFPAEKVKAAEDFIYRKKGNLYFFYGVSLESEKGEIRFLPFLKIQILEKWGVSEEDLYQAARVNARRQPYVIEELEEGCYVIRKENFFWGSMELIYPEGALHELSVELQANLYILFLSPHELIAVPEEAAGKLREAAREIGRSGYVFYYDKDLQEIAASAIEKEELLCRKRQGILDVAEKNLLEGHGV